MKYCLLLLTFSSCCMFKEGHYVDDNVIEEIAEGIIEKETGVDVDLTTSTPERAKIQFIQH